MADSTDPFDTLLTLEDTLYTTAYTLGASDGAHAGRIEGRIFGLEKGFEKFAALGVLHGRSVIWASRLPNPTPSLPSPFKTLEPQQEQNNNEIENKNESNDVANAIYKLPPLPPNPRLQTHTPLLHSLTDPETFSTANTEDAVADYDDRFKRAGAKAKVIQRIVGETDNNATPSMSSSDGSRGTTSRGKGPVRVAGGGSARKMGTVKKGDDSIEDFAGSRLLR
ncbi:Yae1-N domain containing protein [Pyrenophora teres f. maculata]|nr:Yae1-N domain containing protein [Pyrenophora teres f. maculata]